MKKNTITRIISIITVLTMTTLMTFISYAKELIPPEEYGPGFFSQYPDLKLEEVVLSEDKRHVLEVQDEAAIRIGIMEAPVVEEPETVIRRNPPLSENTPPQSDEIEVQAEGKQAQEPTTEYVDPCEQPTIPCNRWGIILSDEDRLVLAQIVYLEGGNQPDEGQQAIVEVVFNRVIDPAFANTVVGVLSQKGQFTTWKSRNRAPIDPRVLMNIAIVENGGSAIFPFNTVYFSRGAQNKRIQARIGGHVFCNK